MELSHRDTCRAAAIALNTRLLDEPAARGAIADADAESGLVAPDPVGFDAGPMVDGVPALPGSREGVG
jgi:uncharacterized NAD-dependent epimerase/dehydratase family protein